VSCQSDTVRDWVLASLLRLKSRRVGKGGA